MCFTFFCCKAWRSLLQTVLLKTPNTVKTLSTQDLKPSSSFRSRWMLLANMSFSLFWLDFRCWQLWTRRLSSVSAAPRGSRKRRCSPAPWNTSMWRVLSMRIWPWSVSVTSICVGKKAACLVSQHFSWAHEVDLSVKRELLWYPEISLSNTAWI